MVDAAYDILAEHVRDPEAYTLSTDRNDYYFICRYNRNIGDFESCDGVTVRFDLAGNILSVDLSYLGALRYLSEVPRELVDQINAYMEQTVVGCISSEIGIGNITVLSDGRIALTCYMEVEYNDAQSDMRQSDATWFLACLTEPIDGNGNEEITVTTTPVTTEPVTTEPVTTQPPRETESQIDWNDVPKFVKFGYLNIAVLDANGDVVYRVDAETLQSMKRSVEVEYVQGGTLILECYAAYNRSGRVQNYRCTAKDGVTEQIDLAEITTELEVDVQAEYVHYLRFSVPIDNMVTDSDRGYSMEMLGDYVYSSIEGRALMEYVTIYLVEAGESLLFDHDKEHFPSYEDYLEVLACIDVGRPPMTDVVEILGKPHGYDSAAGMRIFVWTAKDGGTITVHVLSPDAEPMQWDEILTAEYGGAVAHYVYYNAVE